MTDHHPENSIEYKGLKVNKGVDNISIVNPKFRSKKRQEMSAEEYLIGILSGNVSILGQALTLIESALPSHQTKAQEVIARCLPYAGKSIRLGITGVPGAGKSTFIETLGLYLTKRGTKLAVLAIDPSSERSKGSILGDKTRMEQLSVQENAFIRPSPSAGSLGGVARKTRESIILCEAAGFDTIFVETVGVGQSETAVHSMVDFFLLLQLAGTGDELQGIKRGIMEMADGIAINKCDGTNINKAKIARSQFENALQLFPPPDSGWKPRVNSCSALENSGIAEVWDMVEEYTEWVKGKGFFEKKRAQQSQYWMYESVNDRLKSDFYNNPAIKAMLSEMEQKLFSDKISSFVAANELISRYFEIIKNRK